MDRHISKNPLTLLQPVATMPTAYNEINGFLGSMSATPQDVREQGGRAKCTPPADNEIPGFPKRELAQN